MEGNSHKAISRLFSSNFAGQKEVAWYIQNDERKNLTPRILYQARLSLIFEGEIKSFPDKQKLKEFSTTKLPFQEMLKELLYFFLFFFCGIFFNSDRKSQKLY